MATNVQLKEAVAKLRTQMGLSEREVKDRFQQATDIAYWQNLSPSMGIMDEESLARLGHATLVIRARKFGFAEPSKAWLLSDASPTCAGHSCTDAQFR